MGAVMHLKTFKPGDHPGKEYRWKDIWIERKLGWYEIYGLEKHVGIIMLVDPEGIREFLREDGVEETVIEQVMGEVCRLAVGHGIIARVPAYRRAPAPKTG